MNDEETQTETTQASVNNYRHSANGMYFEKRRENHIKPSTRKNQAAPAKIACLLQGEPERTLRGQYCYKCMQINRRGKPTQPQIGQLKNAYKTSNPFFEEYTFEKRQTRQPLLVTFQTRRQMPSTGGGNGCPIPALCEQASGKNADHHTINIAQIVSVLMLKEI